MLTAVYQSLAVPDYIVLYESQPPHTNWTIRSREVLPKGGMGNENWIVSVAKLPGWELRIRGLTI